MRLGTSRDVTAAKMALNFGTNVEATGKSLAKVECEDGTLFTAICSTNSSEQRETLNFEGFEIKTRCSVDYPAGVTEFVLEGQLYYVPVKHRLRYKHRRSEKLESPGRKCI